MIPVFLASDENYAKYMAVTIYSIISNTKEDINFYVLDGGISNASKNKIKDILNKTNHQIEFIKIDVSLFYKFPNLQHFSLNTYFRYLIPNLKPELKKVLYIDTDMVIQGDICEIYHTDLDKKGLGAVMYINEDVGSFKNYKKELGFTQEHLYFNAGLLLIDCECWRKNNIVDTLFQKTSQLQNKIKLADQDILNFVFENNYHKLAPQYNIVIDMTTAVMDIQKYISKITGCFVLHFTGGRDMRPWVKKDCPAEKYFWKYAIETPFYQDLRTELIINQLNALTKKIEAQNLAKSVKIKLFNIPIFNIHVKRNKKRIYLFGIPIISVRIKSDS